jgi:hypothetical protein
MRLIFASKYLHNQFPYKYSISCKSATNIRLRFSHGEYLLQNIRLEENVRKTLSEIQIQAHFRLQKFTY